MQIRVGLGYDVHQLKEGEEFILGGIKLEHYKGASGHSDADVLIHAICDSLLGAANLGDIGVHFPPSDDQYKGIDSSVLLEKVSHLIRDEGYEIGNIDSVISLQKPKIKDVIPEMKSKVATVLGITESRISIKATTTEKLGFEGREEGVSAQVVSLLQKLPMQV